MTLEAGGLVQAGLIIPEASQPIRKIIGCFTGKNDIYMNIGVIKEELND